MGGGSDFLTHEASFVIRRHAFYIQIVAVVMSTHALHRKSFISRRRPVVEDDDEEEEDNDDDGSIINVIDGIR